MLFNFNMDKMNATLRVKMLGHEHQHCWYWIDQISD